MTMPIPKLRDLQCLRGIAALLVVVDHAADLMVDHGFRAEPLHSVALFAGAQGVAIFFLISGFIMTYTAEGDERGAASVRAWRFACRRVVRVVPLYWIFTALVAVPAWIISLHRPVSITAVQTAKSLFFIPYRNGGGNMTPVLPIGWTLNYEMFFYAIFALLVLTPGRWRTLALTAVLGAFVVAGSQFYPIFSGVNPHSPGEFLTNPVILLFGAGAVLGWLRLRSPGFSMPLPGLLLVAPLLLLNFALYLRMVHGVPVLLAWSAAFWSIDLLAVAACIFGVSVERPWLEALGDASYSLYLVHLLPVFAAFFVWKSVHFLAPVLFVPAAIGASVAVGLACFRWVERPLTRRLSAIVFPGRRTIVLAADLPASCTPPGNPL